MKTLKMEKIVTKDYKNLMDAFLKVFEISMTHIKERLDEIEGEENIDKKCSEIRILD